MARQGSKRKPDNESGSKGGNSKLVKFETPPASPSVTTSQTLTVHGEQSAAYGNNSPPPVSPESYPDDTRTGSSTSDNSNDEFQTPVLPTSIVGITSLLNQLTLRVKIISKSTVTVKSRGAGLFFSFQFTDGGRKMRGVVFGDPCNDIYERLQISAVNPRFGEGYEIILVTDTGILELTDVELEDFEAPYELILVETIYTTPAGIFIDFLGIVGNFGPIQFHAKGSGAGTMKYRNVEFTDEKKFQIVVVFWGDMTENCEQLIKKGDVVILAQVRINEYNQVKRLYFVSQSNLVKKSSHPRFFNVEAQMSS